MARPVKQRMVRQKPKSNYFKPRGVPLRELEEKILTIDETEAVRLADLKGLSHEQSGKKMEVSRQTFGRILASARNKIADAIINGKAINIEGGNFEIHPNFKGKHKNRRNLG
ncbi:MAG: DUF134 domain-containing protein [Desulforegulaceae bacterium]|nr:DUF134 domain-containing protein [Desulforegulaceae bacterium]